MNYQEEVIQINQQAVRTLFRYAREIPEDKLTWKPMDEGRSALEMLQECAVFTLRFLHVLEARGPSEKMNPDYIEQEKADQETLTTLELCEQRCQENCDKLCEIIQNFPDSDLGITMTAKFPNRKSDQEMTVPMSAVMLMNPTHLSYHTGQIAYIQTLYGDQTSH